MMKLAALIKQLQAIYDHCGDVPVMLSVETTDDDGEYMIVHGDLLRAGAEQSHSDEEWFVRIAGDGEA